MAESSRKPEGYVFGRPTEYRPEMCEQVIEWGRQGKSKTWIAAELGVCKRTVQVWEEKHPDFVAALSRAATLSQQWWEDAGQTGMVSDKFNNGVWTKSMSCRFPDDWRDTSRQEQTGPDGGPIKQEVSHTGIDAFTSRIASLAARSNQGPGNSEPDNGTA